MKVTVTCKKKQQNQAHLVNVNIGRRERYCFGYYFFLLLLFDVLQIEVQGDRTELSDS